MGNTKTSFSKLLKVFVWILIAASVGALYISLRSDRYSMEYGFIALGLWILALLINYFLKKKKPESQ